MAEINIYIPDPHVNQQKVLNERRRFNVVNCGRRWGKTVLAQELILSPDDNTNGILHGFPVAYCAPTYKNMMDVWREVSESIAPLIIDKSEGEKRIKIYGGGVVTFWSLDSPEVIRGRKFKRVICDEIAIVPDFEETWTKVLRATLTDLKGDAWFFSTPKGEQNYFYTLFNFKNISEHWNSWQMPTVSNPHIDAEEVHDAELTLDPLSFAQEYLAAFITKNLNSWAYCYDEKKHVGKTSLDKRAEVYLSFDFNRNPITCGVFQHYGGKIFGIEQIKLNNSNIYELCDYIAAKYGGCSLLVTGDATGRASSALVQDNLNYYMVIKTKLRLGTGQFKVPTVNPPLQENRVVVNSILHHRPVTLDADLCKGLIFDLNFARVLADGTLDKTNRDDPTKQLDALDCFRYYLNAFHKDSLKL